MSWAFSAPGPRGIRLLSLLLLSLPAAAQEGDESSGSGDGTVESASDAELTAFRDTATRFTSRMREFEEEARSIIERREQEDKGQLWESYNALLQELGDDERRLRDTAVSKFEAFLRRYPDSPESASIMFRLAELHFEKSEEDWFLADQEYNRYMETLDASSDFENVPETPSKDYSRSVALYRDIIANHKDYKYIDGAYYMLGFCLSDANAKQFDERESLTYYQTLVAEHPTSQFASAAHLRIGEYYFEENQVDLAIPHYEKVVALEGEGGGLYDEGLYKLAWSHYKKSNYDLALDLMTQLLDFSEKQFLDTGKRSSMGKEAIEYSAISFSDVGDRAGEQPVELASAYYDRVGERPFEVEVYKRLADVLMQQARYEDAIYTYQFLQQRYPEDPENPDYQWKIATMYNALGESDSAQQAITDLNDRYNDKTEWWQANQTNPDALSVARGYIERSLSAVAQTRHVKAHETGSPADYAEAAALYQEYLNEFPFADDYYEVQWYLADTLVYAGLTDKAEEQFAQLLKSGEDHNYDEMALYRLSLVRRQKVIDTYNTAYERPADAVIERTVPLDNGTERPIYVVGDLHREYLATFDALNATNLREAVAAIEEQLAVATEEDDKTRLTAQREELMRYQEGVERNRPALSYETAQILYNHGHYEEARTRFGQIIDFWPERDEAAFAAKLIIDSYNAEGDLVNVRQKSALYAGMLLGSEATRVATSRDFKKIQQQAAFLQAQAFMEEASAHRREGNVDAARQARLAAADAFIAYTREFPEVNDTYLLAFYNIGQNYAEAGELEKSNEYFRQYVDRFPQDKNSWPLMFRIANNYASIMELDKAVGYFEQLYRNAGKEYEDAPTALFNAAFLRIGMGDHKGAAEGFERYAREFPGQEDAEKTMFMAGAQWQEVSDREALRFYQRYLQQYRATNPDRMMEAYFQVAELTEKVGGRPAEVDRAWRDLAQAYVQNAGQIGPMGRHYAARAEFRELEKVLAAFSEIRYTRSDQQNAEILIQKKPEELVALEKKALALVQDYQDFEYSSAALFVTGQAYYVYSDMIYNAPVPAEIAADEELRALYDERMDEIRVPVEDKGKARLKSVLELATTQKLWSEWQTQALKLLSDRVPGEFAPEKDELRGQPDSTFVPSGGPMSVRPPSASKEDGQ